MAPVDPISLSQALIRCPSVTPEDAGAIGIVADALERLGFTCHRLRFETPGTAPIENLYACLGSSGPNFCFSSLRRSGSVMMPSYGPKNGPQRTWKIGVL